MTGIRFVLRSGIPWEMLPPETGCGSGTGKTPGAGIGSTRPCSPVWGKRIGSIGAERVWTAPVSRHQGGLATGPHPTDRGKPGTKRHLLTARPGIPLAARLTGANRQDCLLFAPCPRSSVPPVTAGAAQSTSMPTRATTSSSAAPPAGGDPSRPASPAAGASRAPGGDSIAGGGRADGDLAQPLPPPDDPLRAPRRYPSDRRHPRLCPYLRQPPSRPMTVLKDILTAIARLLPPVACLLAIRVERRPS